MKIAFLTSGGIAPCLSSSIASLIQNYNNKRDNFEYIGYLNGYYGLLQGKSISLNFNSNEELQNLKKFGGTILGNSRVKLTNIDDCIQNGYIQESEVPLEIAANQLLNDNVNILHTIGGDDTNTTACDLAMFLKDKGYDLTVVGLPKTIDNDVYPISQTLGADTAAEQGAIFFENIVNENTTSRRQLIIHEVMGRNCGWLTATTAQKYRERLKSKSFYNSDSLNEKCWDIHAVYIPEQKIDVPQESIRLKEIMDRYDCVNVFLSEGAGVDNIISDLESKGTQVRRDAFGHVRLDEINPGKWYANKIADWTNAKKILVQKSGYFARSAAPNQNDISLIDKISDKAVDYALQKRSGVAGLSDDHGQNISCIDFTKIKGGKPFDYNQTWYLKMLNEIGQKKDRK
tara:strand:+ start:3374 stop:4576 length:1203 start_codon:yes stop_codon:yes gene_type:complete